MNPKSLRSSYDEKVLLIVIRPSDGDVKVGEPLHNFRKELINAGTGCHLYLSSRRIYQSYNVIKKLHVNHLGAGIENGSRSHIKNAKG